MNMIRKFFEQVKPQSKEIKTFLPKYIRKYKDKYSRDGDYLPNNFYHNASNSLEGLNDPLDFDHRIGYDYSHLNIR